MASQAIGLMMGTEWASVVFFNFSVNFERDGKWKHAILRVDISEAVLQLIYKEKVKYEVSLEAVQASAAAAGGAMYTLVADDVCRISLPVQPKQFPPLETYGAVDRTIVKELLDTFASEGSLEHLKEAYPRYALHHGVLEKSGKYTWAQRHCIVVKWKFYVFRSWHTAQALQSLCLIGMQDKIARKGKNEIEIATPHKTFTFRAMDASHRDEWYYALMVASSMELKPDAAISMHDPLADADEAYRLSLSGGAPVEDDIKGVGKRTRRKGKKTAKQVEQEVEQAQAAALRMMRGAGGGRGNYGLDATDDDAQADALRVVGRKGKGRKAFDLDASDLEPEQVSISIWVPHTEAQISAAMAGVTEVTALFLGVDLEAVSVESLEARDDGTAVSLCIEVPEDDDEVNPGDVLASIIESQTFAEALTGIYSAVPLLDFGAATGDSVELVLDMPQAQFLATESQFTSAVAAATAGMPVAAAPRTGPEEFGDCTAVRVTAHSPSRVVEEAAADGRMAEAVRQVAATMGWDASWVGTVDVLGEDRVAFCTELEKNSELVGCLVPALLSCTGVTAEITDVLAGQDTSSIILCTLGPNSAASAGTPTVVYTNDSDPAETMSATLSCPSYSSRLATVLHIYESKRRAGSVDTRSGRAGDLSGSGISDFQALIQRIRANDPTLTVVAVRRQLSPHDVNEICAAMMENTQVVELDLRGQSGCADLGVGEALKGLLVANEAVQELNLAGAGLGPNGTALLSSGWALNESLTDVSLAGNGCGDVGIQALVHALMACESIKDVNLADNRITSVGASALATVFRGTDMRIVLTGNEIDDAGASAIAAAIKENAAVTPTIKLAFNLIGPDGACDLIEAVVGRSVHVLDLAHNRIGESGAWALAALLKSGGDVEQVNISGNSITDTGNAYVMEALETNKSVRYMNVAANGITQAGTGGLASMLGRNSTIEHLDVSNNMLGDVGITMLSTALRVNTGIKRLNVGRNNFGPAGARAAADALAGNSTIRRLDISGNDVCDEGVFCLAESLTASGSSSEIKEVEMNDCNITSAVAQSLAQLVQKQGVQNLDLGNNPSFGDTGAAALARGIPTSIPILYVNVYLAGLSASGKESLSSASNVVVLESATHEARSTGSQIKKYRALYAYEPDAGSEGCISFAAGDIIIGVESSSANEWLRGYVENKGSASTAGYFPSAFAALLPMSDPVALRKAYGGTTTFQWGTSGRQHRDADDQAFMRSYLSDERRRVRLEQLGQLEQRHARRAVVYASVNRQESSRDSHAAPDLSTSGAGRMEALARLESSRAQRSGGGRDRAASGGGMLALLAYWRQVEGRVSMFATKSFRLCCCLVCGAFSAASVFSPLLSRRIKALHKQSPTRLCGQPHRTSSAAELQRCSSCTTRSARSSG